MKQRIITAAILAPLFVLALYQLPVVATAILLGMIVLLAAWEWSGFIRQSLPFRIGYVGVVALLLSGIYLYASVPQQQLLIWIGMLWLGLAINLVLRYPRISPVWGRSEPLKSMLGLLVLIPMWLAALELQRLHGTNMLMLLLLLIWAADIGAYFSGRKWGRNKLAATVSPGKSWEGALGGMLAATAVALVAIFAFDFPLKLLYIAVIVIAASIIGDLGESLFKRMSGCKDSGSILPGHGGILDRIDSLTTALPLFFVLVSETL